MRLTKHQFLQRIRRLPGGQLWAFAIKQAWAGCIHRNDKPLSPSVRWVLGRRSKTS